MLSHSSKGSAKHADVDKVVEATKLARDGSLALGGGAVHAAIVPEIGASKAPFRLLDMLTYWYSQTWMQTIRIGYKLVQNLVKGSCPRPNVPGVVLSQ